MWRSAFLVAVSGCYFYYPHGQLPEHGKPVPEPGAQIELEVTKEDTWRRECSSLEVRHERCQVHNGKLMWRGVEYKVVASYQGNQLTQGELYMLADPAYDGRVEHIRSKNGACNVSLVPSAIAALGIAAGFVALALNNNDEGPLGHDQMTFVTRAGVVTFGASAIASFPLGGYACWSAHREAQDIGLYSSKSVVWYFDTKAEVAPIQALVDAFNAKQAGHVPEPDETPAQEPAAKPEPAPAQPESATDIVGAIATSGCCTIFLRALAATDMTKTLREAGPLVVFAYSDKQFASVDPARIERALAEHDQVAKELANHISREAWSPASLAGGRQRLRMLSGKKLDLHGSPTAIKAGGASVIGELAATNGAVYIVDRVVH